jgi:predicted DCC family thiol-disulfide oxidoreductase YuxK
MLTADEVKNIDTIVLLRKGQSYRKSTAVLKVVAGLGGSYSLAAIALLVPRFFRDYLYDLFAKRRKKISLACRLLTADERRRFLP